MTLRDYRLLAGLTQVQAAKKLRVVQTAVSGWEVGRRTPDKRHIKKIAKVYGRTVEEIVEAVQNPKLEMRKMVET